MAVININRNQFEEMVHSGKNCSGGVFSPLVRILPPSGSSIGKRC